MRRLIFIFLFSFSVHSQTVDSLLIPYVNEYIQQAKIHNVDVSKKLWELRYVKYKHMTRGLLGTYTGQDVLINDYYMDDYKLVRAVVYHEFGHVMGVKHLCGSCFYLMASAVGHINFSNMDDTEWEKYKTDYFNSIKNKNSLINTKIIKNGKNNRKTKRRPRQVECTDFRLE